MPGNSLLGALPLGLLMFVGTAAALLWRKWHRQRAAQNFPALARDLGLEYSPPRHAGGVGTLVGTQGERHLRIDPDDQRLLKVRFRGSPRVDLRSYEHATAPYDMITVYSRDRDFDRFFQTRLASEAIAQRIAADERPGRYVEVFQGAHARQIQSVTVTSDGVVCRFDYMPADALRELVPACVALAELIEPGVPSPAEAAAPADSSTGPRAG